MIKPAQRNFGFRFERPQVFSEARVSGGMVTSVDRADLETGQLAVAKNVTTRYDLTSRRTGTTLYTPIKPNSVKVLNVSPFVRFSGSVSIVRLTKSSVHLGSTVAWTPIAGVLTGGDNDRFSTSVLNDRFFFANGVDNVKEINVGASTFANAGNAPKAKYITGFFNRLVTANVVGVSPNPIEIDWSGDFNFTEFNPVVDISAGFAYLTESPSDYADFITGLFGFAQQMLILRERSLWVATKQPSATDPFHFASAIPNVGCDAPYTAAQIPNGIAWLDFRTGTVYGYTVGMQAPEPIGRNVERTIMSEIQDSALCFGSYDTLNNEYSLAIPSSLTSSVKVWTFNFRNKAWSYNEYENLSVITDLDFSGSSLVVDGLSGTVDSLLGTVDSLSIDVSTVSRFLGFNDGDIEIVNKTGNLDNGLSYTTEVVSKTFTLPTYNEYVCELRIEYEARSSGSFLVEFSKDNGVSWYSYKTVSFVGAAGIRLLSKFKKNIRCRQYTWRITSSSGLFDIIGYEIYTIPGAQSTR